MICYELLLSVSENNTNNIACIVILSAHGICVKENKLTTKKKTNIINIVQVEILVSPGLISPPGKELEKTDEQDNKHISK